MRPASVLLLATLLLSVGSLSLGQEQLSGPQPASGSERNEQAALGTTDFLITGWAFGGFESSQGKNSNFSSGVSPILLWKLGDRIFFESEVEISLESGETSVDLEYAHLAYC